MKGKETTVVITVSYCFTFHMKWWLYGNLSYRSLLKDKHNKWIRMREYVRVREWGSEFVSVEWVTECVRYKIDVNHCFIKWKWIEFEPITQVRFG